MSFKNFFRRMTSAVLSFLTAIAAIGCPESGAAHGADEYYPIAPPDPDIPSYSRYFDMYGGLERPASDVTICGSDYFSAENGEFSTGSYVCGDDVREDVLVWESPEGEVTYSVDVPETGVYCLGVSYLPLSSNSPQIALSIAVDDEIPFDTASRVTLNRVWVNETEIAADKRGNQIRPAQKAHEMWLDCTVGDSDGLFNEPLSFYLTRGEHKVSLSSERAGLVIDKLRFFAPEELPDYHEYRASVSGTAQGTGKLRIEGESAAYKSDPTLYPTSDNSSYLVSPADPVKVVYNTLGADNWSKALQSATWTIDSGELEEGWYRLGIKARQNKMRGFYSNRRIYIDGEVPCRELDQVSFFYDKDWSVTTPKTADGEDIYVYLSGGDHTITLECVPGKIGEPLRRLESAAADLSQCYRDIVMITGSDPDKYTDYYVHEKLPDIVPEFQRISGELKSIRREIEGISGSSGSEAAALDTMAVILDKCVKKPLKIPDYLSQIKDNITSVSALLRDYRDQPLEIDYIELAAADAEFSGCRENFFKSVLFALKSFFSSFFEDYNTISDVEDKEAVEVWVALGRDQAQVVKELTESDFIRKFDTPVSVNLVSGGIVEASLAGKGPDVALFVGDEFPVNLAARGLLVDVSEFSGYDEVAGRFQENAMTQYRYNGGTYGLPITQSFPMMFYRTDILAELGFTSPPETWTELIDMLPALQRNYMSAGLVLPPNGVSPATELGHTFALLMLQKGVGYYNGDLTASTFDTTAAVQSFEEWTDFYTKYSFEQTYDPFSRFRTGEYPIVIEDYTFANQLTAAAPEISGLWDFCPVPGTLREDGTVSHAANSNGTGAVIFSKAADKEGAWDYISWFTDAETQARFGTQIEGLMGTLGRFETANTEALSRLSWSAEELRRIEDQRSQLEEIPIIPASYAVTRNIMNAFRETVNEGENPRDTLIWYNKDINEEIARKSEKLIKN